MNDIEYLTRDDVIREMEDCLFLEEGLKSVATTLQISPSHLCNILAKRKKPNRSILDLLGLEEITLYVRKI